MKVLYFSAARLATSLESEDVVLPGSADAAEVWRLLIARHPALETLRESARLSRNEGYADAETRFSNDDVVAVIPPVSGG
jgi:molybdopterin converting factor small subunit